MCSDRDAVAQGKDGEFAKNIKNMFLHRKFNYNTGKNFKTRPDGGWEGAIGLPDQWRGEEWGGSPTYLARARVGGRYPST